MNIVGSILNNEPYCIDCLSPTRHIIFDSNEVDCPLTCNECHEIILTSLTSVGKKYVKDLIIKAYYTKSNISLIPGFTDTYSDIYHEILEEINENYSIARR